MLSGTATFVAESSALFGELKVLRRQLGRAILHGRSSPRAHRAGVLQN